MIFDAMIDIAMISLALSVISQVIQNKFVDRDEMKRKQAEIKEKQAKMKELMQKDDPKSKNELEALEKEMMEAMQKMMSGSTKVMMYSMIVFLPAFAILGFFYSEVLINLPIPIPWLSNGFDLFNIGTWGVELYSETNWYGWYFLAYLAITIVINIGKKLVKNMGVMNG